MYIKVDVSVIKINLIITQDNDMDEIMHKCICFSFCFSFTRIHDDVQ